MRFRYFSSGGNGCCWWIQASGEITADTPRQFSSFLSSLEYGSDIIRLDSPGGDLAAGIALGEIFRTKGFRTEVGSTTADGTWMSPGSCASACAYAFLGGVERRLESESKLGFHRFFTKNALSEPATKLFTGEDLDGVQRSTAGLVLYALRMGVDPRLIGLASGAGPTEMRWLSAKEAQELRVVYYPSGYKPWRVEPYRGGAIAVTESNDGSKRIVAGCSRRTGTYVALIDRESHFDPQLKRDLADWFEQCRKMGPVQGRHPVFGALVPSEHVEVIRPKGGGAMMRFRLPSVGLKIDSAEFLTFAHYPRSCSSGDFFGSKLNLEASVRLALRACYDE